MKYTTHIIYGILVFLIVLNFYPLTILEKVLALALAIIGSILPDIDSHKSKIGKYFFFLNYGCTHRGFLHSIGGIVLISASSILLSDILELSYVFAILFTASFVSHIILDALNKKGIRPFYPLKFKIKGFVKNGSIGEWAVLGLGILAILFLL